MRRILARELALAFVLAILIAILYRSWLIHPILKYMTLWQARMLALFVGVILAGTSGLLRLSPRTCTLAFMVGLLAGGTWGAMFRLLGSPDLLSGFGWHLRFMWREVVVLTLGAAACNLGIARVRRLKKPSSAHRPIGDSVSDAFLRMRR
jgi:hypothetical protein